jgi:peptidoglycan/xylan/chitin deacetylase (PgdA/CDA1 family)
MKKFFWTFLFLTACGLVESDVAPHSPLIVLTFDDGHKSIFELAFPEMQKYNYPGVSFDPTGFINSAGKMTLENIRELESAGWESGGHSVTHANLTTLTIDSARSEIRMNYEQLVNLGLKHRCFAYPSGHSNSEIDKIILQYFSIIRTAQDQRYGYPINLGKLGYVQAQQNDDANSLLMRVAHGITEGESVIIFGFHLFTEGEPTYITMLKMSAFRGLLAGIHKRNLEVVTLSEAVDRLIKLH